MALVKVYQAESSCPLPSDRLLLDTYLLVVERVCLPLVQTGNTNVYKSSTAPHDHERSSRMAKLAQRLLEHMQGSKLHPRIAWLRTAPIELWGPQDGMNFRVSQCSSGLDRLGDGELHRSSDIGRQTQESLFCQGASNTSRASDLSLRRQDYLDTYSQ